MLHRPSGLVRPPRPAHSGASAGFPQCEDEPLMSHSAEPDPSVPDAASFKPSRTVVLVGLMGSLVLTPDKAKRAKFPGDDGDVGYRCRERCFANDLIMRAVGERMIIAPPLVITPAEIDLLVDRARKSLDECLAGLQKDGLMRAR